jgi:hypothetical protein
VAAFVFNMTVSGETSREMLNDVAGRLLERAGIASDGAVVLAGELEQALLTGGRLAGEPISIEFRVTTGRLDVVVSSRSGELLRVSRHNA